VAGAATPGIDALVDAGVPHQIVKFDHDPREPSFGVEAVHALTKAGGIAPEQIYKTLVIAVPGGLAVAIVPASARLSLKAAAAALGVAKAGMAEPAAAERGHRLRAGRRVAVRPAQAPADGRRRRCARL
jgi:Cys-tRNA(Pro)/Cys-tRNA(Cys) deacylase